MTGINKLKDEARKHEQREEWEKAIKAYQQVLADAEGGELELPLYNRVGDLFVRLGRREDAVRYYEQAADRYAEAGLFNNAIALCNKALRYTPGRLSVLRRLGQFSASQGFLTDARTYLTQFAEKSFASGDTDEALTALTDYANISGDAEIRELIGRKLHGLGRTKAGMSELKRAYALHLGAGEAEAAAELRREILRIEPSAFDDEVEGGTLPETPHSVVLPARAERLPDLPDLLDEPAVEEAPIPVEAPLLSSAFPDLDELEPEGGSPPALLDGFETTMLEPGTLDSPEGGELSGLESAPEFVAEYGELPKLEGLEQAEPVDAELGEAPPRDELMEDELVMELPELEDTAAAPPRIELMEDHLRVELSELEDVGATRDFELPLLGEEPEPELESEPEPMLESEPESELDAELASELESEPESELEPLPLIAGFDEPVDQDELPIPDLPVLDGLEAVEDTTPLPLLGDVDEPEEPQEDLPLLAGTEPIEHLPLLEDAEPAAPSPPQPAEYVNLRELLVDDEQRNADTRFTVAEQAPSGDEDDDFAELLSQFRRKVAENVAPEDAAAHYDLGLAFKDMGLLDEAIGELQVALQAGDKRLRVFEELGLCFLLKKEYSIAEKVLRRALKTKYDDELELLGVYYHLGRACEELGKPDLARDAYERVLALDINFGDVSERIARL